MIQPSAAKKEQVVMIKQEGAVGKSIVLNSRPVITTFNNKVTEEFKFEGERKEDPDYVIYKEKRYIRVRTGYIRYMNFQNQ